VIEADVSEPQLFVTPTTVSEVSKYHLQPPFQVYTFLFILSSLKRVIS